HDSARAADVYSQLGDHHRRVANLWRDPPAQGGSKRMVAHPERFGLDCLWRDYGCPTRCRSVGGCLDHRMVRGPIRLHLRRPGVPTEEVQEHLTAISTERRVKARPAFKRWHHAID